ncbi:MAG: adenylyltransferase/cytidyltransferase family protein [Phycisphaerales bacterium]|nr:adenylyltransferase/cytidyltransferase family protein [Phycisphaerales bacterium]
MTRPAAAHLSFQHKIVDPDALVELADSARRNGRTIVQCHGCFDIVHPGHIRYLEFARRQGDLLIVTLTGDADIGKGTQRPYIPQELRAESLAALECVDLVCIDPHPTAERILDAVKPTIYVKGREYDQSHDPGFLREKTIVEKHGGRVLFSSGEIVFSSTRLIDAIPQDPAIEHHRLCVVCERHGINRETLGAVMDRFAGLRVIVVGDIVMDRYVFCDALSVASEAPMMALKRLDEQVYVGGAAIVARHVAALGADAFLLSAVAGDEPSERVTETLDREGVRSHLIRCRPQLIEKTRFLVDDTKLLKVESAEHIPLDSVAERKAVDVLRENAPATDLIIFCDFGYGVITGGFLQRVLPALRRTVPVITADVSGPRANLLEFQEADLLSPTERELRTNLNDYESGLSAAAHHLLRRTHARHLFVTLEKKGLVAFDRPTQDPTDPQWNARLLSEHLPTFADRVIDRLGAGDALLAAASLALAAGGDLNLAAYLGNGAAALEIARLGNVPIDAASLRRWIGRRAELSAHVLTSA